MASSSSQASQQMGNAMRNNNTKKSKKVKKALPPRALSQRIANRLASKPQNMNTRNNSHNRKSMKASKKASKKSLTYAQSLRGTRSKNPQVSAAGKAFLSQLNAYKANGMSNVAAGAAAGAALASQLPVVAEHEEAYDPVMGSLASAFQGFNVKKNARNHGYQGASSSSAAPAQPVMVAPSFLPYGSGSSAPVFSFSVAPGQDKPYMGFAQPSLAPPPNQAAWLQPSPFSRA
jgi:hypothetical protein